MSVAGGRITAGLGSNLIGIHSADRNQDATCYVGNIDPQANEELIWELFVQAGPVGARPCALGGPSDVVLHGVDCAGACLLALDGPTPPLTLPSAVNVYMPKDRVTGDHQSYGFVEFRGEEDADYAIKASQAGGGPPSTPRISRRVAWACIFGLS